jgi:hypothetical protein
MKTAPDSPKPTKVVRSLKLSKEKVAQLTENGARLCTKRATGCPVHTC